MKQFFLYTRYDLLECFNKHIIFKNIDLNGGERILNALHNLLAFIGIDSIVELIEFEIPGKIRFGLKAKENCSDEQFKFAVKTLQEEFEHSKYSNWTSTEILDLIQFLLKKSNRLKEKLFVGVTNKREDEIKLKYYPKHNEIIYVKSSSKEIAKSVYSTLLGHGYHQLEEMDEARNIIIFSTPR